ncbi:hypothetical protein B5M42_017475 [Paenibacillus athensensis]|uniref:Uncharacterized protein n=1 Tax=Paenibacillus athensensis TaxID=1967502 RepID=A0A4Y8PW47_9BACL|nr:CBO0543 family protein [Paenibacillus athensensis]MCD1260596.1 hypothetical protein [Paenibacillus athensensis]
MNNDISPTYEELMQARERLHKLDWNQWKTDALFTWQWWLLVGLTVVPLILWWNFVDKKRAYEIAFYGCMINISALLLDDFGTNLSWWGYPLKLLPILPPLVTADSVLVPIALMVVYQLFSTGWKKFLLANLIMGVFLAYVAEPVFIWIGYYDLYTWKAGYSLLYYVSASTLARFIIIKLVK